MSNKPRLTLVKPRLSLSKFWLVVVGRVEFQTLRVWALIIGF